MIEAHDLERLSRYFTPIHHVPGRIRLRVDPAIQKESTETSLLDVESFIDKIPGIKSLKINKLVASLTIEYDKAIFPFSLWEDLLGRKNLEEVAARIDTLTKEIRARG
ncbi:HMA2 domain-containing protein [Wolinella succinogenes]|uniref:HMA domain-containing protein n=1 Tax=Wolinella succinogenes (strain ATCC 29543 / DSM 1740 / CCUG 13145 / JCM 31913 / LMG 7466 / NCTC 11488 / FDC 602W) TaxID=273121 RepID=Q7MR87_WOLSU|nr:hypothetical protein [Wolinella succinogenes]CAE10616.1 hypothetical protein WS1576 [Wolinella succinogenes]VEG80761.1 Uncharacterised protein [Wolinella succinogenes]HCZ18709.1 hypothetical protein [Helicobacter sp.]